MKHQYEKKQVKDVGSRLTSWGGALSKLCDFVICTFET